MKGTIVPPPKKGDAGYEEYLIGFNERRRKRLLDPEYKAKERARQKASRERLKAKRAAEKANDEQ